MGIPARKGRGMFALDFDGVLNSYMQGWQGPTVIEEPVAGAQDFVRMLVAETFQPVVSSTRASTREGLTAVVRWMEEHEFPDGIEVTHEKVPAVTGLDDRLMRFDGLWPTMTMIEAACRPWNR